MNTIKQSDITPAEWSGGKTWTYYIRPPSATLPERNFDIRISSASVEEEQSTFSDFTGFTRYFTVLTSEVDLCINGKTEHISRDKIIKFSGSDVVSCMGKTVDFNVIVKDDLAVDVFFASGQIIGPMLVFTGEELIDLDQGETTTLNWGICIKMICEHD